MSHFLYPSLVVAIVAASRNKFKEKHRWSSLKCLDSLSFPMYFPSHQSHRPFKVWNWLIDISTTIDSTIQCHYSLGKISTPIFSPYEMISIRCATVDVCMLESFYYFHFQNWLALKIWEKIKQFYFFCTYVCTMYCIYIHFFACMYNRMFKKTSSAPLKLVCF